VTVYDAGLGDVPADASTSVRYLNKACELHDKMSCARRSFDKTADDTSTLPGRINASLRQQCTAGNAERCEQFGRNANNGVGMPKDPVTGAEYLKMACLRGQTSACATASPSASPSATR